MLIDRSHITFPQIKIEAEKLGEHMDIYNVISISKNRFYFAEDM